MPQGATLRVDGLAQLNRAFNHAPKALKKESRAGQRRIAEPTRLMAQARAVTEIRNMRKSKGMPWSKMRTGVTQRLVYVAPKERGRRSRSFNEIRRPNLKDLLLDRAMIPALEAHEQQILREFDGYLAAVGRDWERH